MGLYPGSLNFRAQNYKNYIYKIYNIDYLINIWHLQALDIGLHLRESIACIRASIKRYWQLVDFS
jgi:hypothetical protein